MKLISGLSPQREAQVQNRLIDNISKSIELPLRKEIQRTMLRLAGAYGNTGKIAGIGAEHKAAVAKIINTAYKNAFATFGNRFKKATQKSHAPTERKYLYGGYDKAARDWIALNAGEKITMISSTTLDQVKKITVKISTQAVIDGYGQAEISKMIRSEVRAVGGALSNSRASVIARTETHAASQAANDLSAKDSGLSLEKIWIASDTDRTRETHSEASGQSVGLNEDFEVGGESMSCPGDPSGSAENVINCRCVLGHRVI